MLITVLLLAGVACYRLGSTRTLLTNAPVWTGTGTRAIGGSRYSVGLAGQDVYHFSSNSHWVETAPFLSQFGGPYELTGYVQNRTFGHHETEFIHGNLAGRTDNLRLLFKSHPGNPATWVEPAGLVFYEGGDSFEVVQICGLAASESHNFITPDSPDSHVFLSFRARSLRSGTLVGGVLEIQTDRASNGYPTRWWIRTGMGGLQVAIRRQDGRLFPNECMPISVTSGSGQSRQYLAIGNRPWDEILIFDAFRLWTGPIDSWRQEDRIRDMMDLVVESRRIENTDFVFLAVLWDGQQNRLLRHYTLVNGGGDPSPFLTETLQPHVRLIESANPSTIASSADLFTYGREVERRTYVE